MKENHASGLLGYSDDLLNAKVYDPALNTYVNYVYWGAPFPANKFTETFKVVVFYKKPSRDYFQDIKLLSLSTVLVEIIIGSMMLVVLYLVLYSLANAYIDLNNLPDKLSHHFMLIQFRKIVGLSLSKVLIIVLFVIIFMIGVTVFSVQKLRNHYKDIYASDQERLRTELLDKVSPYDTLTGVVFRRFYQQKARTSETSSGKTIYYYFAHYTIEFKNLMKIPVYLDLKLDEKRPEVKELDKLFSDTIPNVPNYLKEYTFIVNSDYSISLKMNTNTPEE